jgi:hypothetical protein
VTREQRHAEINLVLSKMRQEVTPVDIKRLSALIYMEATDVSDD